MQSAGADSGGRPPSATVALLHTCIRRYLSTLGRAGPQAPCRAGCRCCRASTPPCGATSPWWRTTRAAPCTTPTAGWRTRTRPPRAPVRPCRPRSVQDLRAHAGGCLARGRCDACGLGRLASQACFVLGALTGAVGTACHADTEAAVMGAAAGRAWSVAARGSEVA